MILIGNLGKDPEVRHLEGGASVANFTMATSESYKDKAGNRVDQTEWHNIVMWRTENIANYLLKGKQIYIEGRLESRSYEDKEGQKRYITEVVCEANNAVLLGGGGGRSEGASDGGDYSQDAVVSRPRSAQRPQPAAAPAEDFGQGITDDDVPF